MEICPICKKGIKKKDKAVRAPSIILKNREGETIKTENIVKMHKRCYNLREVKLTGQSKLALE